MGLRTRSAGAKVTDEEYAELEKLAEAEGITLGEWCRKVLLAQLKAAPPAAAGGTDETLLAEMMALRAIVINIVTDQMRGEPLSKERLQELIRFADTERFRRADERRKEAATWKRLNPEE